MSLIDDDIYEPGITSAPAYEGENSTKLIKICNIPGHATGEEVCTLFAFFGEIDMFTMYPTEESITVNTKIAYMRFFSAEHCAGAIHLTNTVFLDRPLIIIPIPENVYPDEKTSLEEAKRWSTGAMFDTIAGLSSEKNASLLLNVGFTHFPPKPEYDPKLPPLILSELYRTIYVGNVHHQVSAEALLTLFSGVGEVKHVRVGNIPGSDTKYALVEFSDVSSIQLALQYHNFPLYGVPIKTDYAKISICKSFRDISRRRSKRSNSFDRDRRRNSSPRYLRKDESPEWRRTKYESRKWSRRSPKSSQREKDPESALDSVKKEKKSKNSSSSKRRDSRSKSPHRRRSPSSPRNSSHHHKKHSRSSKRHRSKSRDRK